MFNVALPLSFQACQLVAGQKQLRSPLSWDSGWLDGWNENFALQGGLLWGQLQLLRHPGQDLHWVRQPQTHTVSYPAYSCQECLQVPSTRGKTQEFEETIGEEHTHTNTCTHIHTCTLLFSLSKESYRALTKGVLIRVMVIHNDRPLATASVFQTMTTEGEGERFKRREPKELWVP